MWLLWKYRPILECLHHRTYILCSDGSTKFHHLSPDDPMWGCSRRSILSNCNIIFVINLHEQKAQDKTVLVLDNLLVLDKSARIGQNCSFWTKGLVLDKTSRFGQNYLFRIQLLILKKKNCSFWTKLLFQNHPFWIKLLVLDNSF